MAIEPSEKFAPRYLSEETIIQQGSETWIPFIEVDVVFSLEIFFQVMVQLALNPQQTSPTVLRADILIDDTGENLHHPPNTTACFRRIRRVLIPRRPELDQALVQDITFHRSPFDPPSDHVIYTPLVDTASSLPYHHPKVRRLLFSYHVKSPRLCLSVLLFPSAAPFTTTTHLSSSLTTLLRTVHRFGHGTMRGYTQRVHHDILVSKSGYQDTYARLKSKYRGWVERWRGEGELCTDPQKHVFEDIGIATWLILLWERMEPRPRGFVDIGAGNGFLVHILSEEGYDGYGIEMRPRKIWELYGEKTRLVARTIDPRTERVEDGTFLIGNHADELTAWIPIISALSGPHCSFVLIPCCFYSLVGRFNQPVLPESGGRYRTYQIYLQEIAEQCGYKVEYESLRIPSTKNVALVGRGKKYEAAAAEEAETRRVVEGLMREAGEGFVPRVEDGKVRRHQR